MIQAGVRLAGWERVGPFAAFADAQQTAVDVDPVYPVLRWVIDWWGLTPDEAARLVLLHVAFYNVASALTALELDDPAGHGLPLGNERRRLRDPAMLRAHLDDLAIHCEGAGGPAAWLSAGSWHALVARVARVFQNDRWAAYKVAEMAAKVLDHPYRTTVIDFQHQLRGPRQGLRDVYGSEPAGTSPRALAVLEARAREVQAYLYGLGITGDMAEVETHLCDWHATVSGRYYVGHDVDLMLRQAIEARSAHVTTALLAARAAVIPACWLGEDQGWTGVRRDLKRWWPERHRLDWWTKEEL